MSWFGKPESGLNPRLRQPARSLPCGLRRMTPGTFFGVVAPGLGQAKSGVEESHVMALSDIDRNLLQRCLARKPRAWEDFVDRFMGLVVHVVNHSAQSRSLRLTSQDREDLVG